MVEFTNILANPTGRYEPIIGTIVLSGNNHTGLVYLPLLMRIITILLNISPTP